MKILQQKVVVPIYIIILLLGFFYVKSVLKKDQIVVKEKETEETSFEVKPAVAYLEVDYIHRTDSYRVRMENKDTVIDFLNYLRENEGFSYEITSNIYGTEFDHINGVEPGPGQKWQLVRKAGEEWEDITVNAGKERLEDETEYKFRLIYLED
jgi:hypothetical protein